MPNTPRRTLLGGIGSTLAVAAAGCLSAFEDGDEDDDGDDTTSDILEYLPTAAGDESMLLTVTDIEAQETVDTAMSTSTVYYGGVLDEDASPTKSASVANLKQDDPEVITVFSGDPSVNDDVTDVLEGQETTDGIEYELADPHPDAEDIVVGVSGETVIAAESVSLLEDAFESATEDSGSFLEEYSTVGDAFETFSRADTLRVFVGMDDDGSGSNIDPDDVRFTAMASTVIDEYTIEEQVGIEFVDESVITDEVREELEADFGTGPRSSEIEEDGPLVTATWTRDLEAEQEARDHVSPSVSPAVEVDPNDDFLELEVTRGDPTPLEELTLELNDEEYDETIWADGKDEIEAGDTLSIEMDDVEPNQQLRIRHDHPNGSSSMGTTILNHFRFDFEYDRETETVTVAYVDDREFPLDGDYVSLSIVDETYHGGGTAGQEPTVFESLQPWEGAELSVGDEATIDGAEIDSRVLVGWKGDEPQDSIANHIVSPPGSAQFEYDYDADTLDIELGLDGCEPADAYELRVDDQPAAVQWTDEYETVDDGASIILEGIDVGSTATVVWVEDDVDIGWTTARPHISLALEGNGDELELTHDGGPSLPATDLTATIRAGAETEDVDFETLLDGEFADGDTATFDAPSVETIVDVRLEYHDEYRVGSAWLSADEL
ncbi:hypothetical protein [Halostagnicola sp. A-GB9-2]|uniref:hypothetical protein n=1 Tax=Halostagnicola sp. A-GB9-2 TaxID=3048066 RepID=UPI0024C09F6F|nr:hypothetical protein [Halostagnicola sp. A-GB9-2]MDJ1433146.1 hypothetical protein [Halostagnicola sp. A-GB9-2]